MVNGNKKIEHKKLKSESKLIYNIHKYSND